MFKNVVLLSVDLAMTAAHDYTVGADAVRIDDDDTISKVVGHHSHLRAIWPQEPPTAPKRQGGQH